MRKYFLLLSCCLGMIHDICADQTGLPSVADVFGNMSEDEITRQVQMGQQFLADLEKYGTPEEKAEFEKILLETLNSMSEQDFQDIQNIAKMVEPHLEPIAPQPTPQPTAPAPKSEEVAPKTSGDNVEKIKNLIAAIINRIDEIVQKIESSKECKEEFDARWSNRATFSSFKRQIAQLKNHKLADKLSKSDLSEDDKKLVETLENFLTELTEKNNKLVIEDTFGLTDSKDLEKKYLKQTKDSIAMFDNFIDSLSPKLEKFLTKWDPEALQLAKEASQKSDKALEDAKLALKRVGSPDARTTPQDRNSGRSGYRDYDSYPNMYNPYDYSPDMYSQYPGYQETGPEGLSDSASRDKSGNPSNTSAAPGNTPTPKKNLSEIDQKLKSDDKTKSDTFEDVIDSMESHFEQYTNTQADKNINFLNNVVANGYKNLTPALDAKVRTWGTSEDGDKAQGTHPNIQGVSEWTFHSFIPYTESISKSLETEYQDFINELDSAKRVCSKVENSAKDFSEEEIKKVSNKINILEQRSNSYQSSYNNAINTIQDSFKKNFALITDRVIVGDPVEEHSKMPIQVQGVQDKFVAQLKDTIGDKITNVIANIKAVKSNIDRKSKRKSKSSKSSSLVINANA